MKNVWEFLKSHFKAWFIPAVILAIFIFFFHKDFKAVVSFLAGVSFAGFAFWGYNKFIKK